MRSLVLLSVLLLCSSGLQGDLTAQADEPETVVISVDSTNLRFSPSSVTITEGDTVRFFWSGQALPHNAVENNGVFDSGDPARAVDYSFTFERGMNGTY
ncbi:MAG: plastocyanin/azurin family copper-binding protein, partial [Candidatus Thermoplasmatota archaeon]|nr:plastocyanin/azurin family copper-binding protein [Candidatus Thermoplasmatota archaeon]